MKFGKIIEKQILVMGVAALSVAVIAATEFVGESSVPVHTLETTSAQNEPALDFNPDIGSSSGLELGG
jgi:hypothetical protein